MRISPRPMTNGGVMIGSTVRMRRIFLWRNPVRVTISANASPSDVQQVAQTSASISVFHATPQRVWLAMQPRPHIFSVLRRL